MASDGRLSAAGVIGARTTSLEGKVQVQGAMVCVVGSREGCVVTIDGSGWSGGKAEEGAEVGRWKPPDDESSTREFMQPDSFQDLVTCQVGQPGTAAPWWDGSLDHFQSAWQFPSRAFFLPSMKVNFSCRGTFLSHFDFSSMRTSSVLRTSIPGWLRYALAQAFVVFPTDCAPSPT